MEGLLPTGLPCLVYISALLSYLRWVLLHGKVPTEAAPSSFRLLTLSFFHKVWQKLFAHLAHTLSRNHSVVCILMYTPSCVQRYHTQSGFLWLGVGNTGITTLSAVPAAIFLELITVVGITQTLQCCQCCILTGGSHFHLNLQFWPKHHSHRTEMNT